MRRITHHTLRFEDRFWEGESYWEETYLYDLTDSQAIEVVRDGGNIAPGDLQRLDPAVYNLEGYRPDGTIYLFRSGEDRHFWPMEEEVTR